MFGRGPPLCDNGCEKLTHGAGVGRRKDFMRPLRRELRDFFVAMAARAKFVLHHVGDHDGDAGARGRFHVHTSSHWKAAGANSKTARMTAALKASRTARLSKSIAR